MSTRIFALFFSLLTFGNLLGDRLWPGFDGNLWWISFGRMPAWLTDAVLAVFSVAMIRFAFRSPERTQRLPFTAALALLIAGIALANAIGFYQLLAQGRIVAGCPVPFSLVIWAGMIFVARAAWLNHVGSARIRYWRVAAGALALFAIFP